MRRSLYYSLLTLGLAAALPAMVVLLFLLWIWIYYDWHFESAATRRAIYSDAQMLIAQTPQNDTAKPLARMVDGIPIPRPVALFPPHFDRAKAIAALKPLVVSIDKDGVQIVMRPGFDESGYFVPRKGKPFNPPKEPYLSYKPIGDGVWWFHYRD